MRTTFIQTLCELAERDERIWLLCGDLGFSVLEVFAKRFPKRYVNAGVAEQNLTGMAAGLAMSGKVVFTYSIANFPLLRCLEQIRNDVCYHRANVKVVAVGGGLSYGAQGYTHHGIEDLAAASALPGFAVLAPGDPVETRLATQAIAGYDGPCYLRLGKAGEPVVYEKDPEFVLGRAIRVMEGRQVTIVSTGSTLALAVESARALESAGISGGVLSIPSVRPLDQTAILAAATAAPVLVTVEEHRWGGLGTSVAELLAIAGSRARFAAIRLPDEPFGIAGSQEYLRERAGLTVNGVVAAVRRLLD